MLSRTVRRALQDANLPPTYLLPFRARLSTVGHTIDPEPVPEPLLNSAHISRQTPTRPYTPPVSRQSSTQPAETATQPTAALPAPTSTSPSTPTTPLSDSIKDLLPLLRSQTPHYITAHLHGRPYLLTQGDTLRLPFLMPGVQPGDILRLNRASVVGSRDYTLKAGAPAASVASLPKEELGHADIRAKQSYVDERLFVCRAVVMGVEAEPMRIKEKTKQRQRHVRQVKSKHKFTVLRVQELRVRSLEEVEGLA
ncbi:hypothetical protein W97_01066 [Coniosporium apollinis CBS 100218]|uniref:Large ribosomal subunit protein bL21m n=1 Tax=Coniosporium apollinis (strain CBS 100218) TaxID=1168221 RepID=R7YIY1_CONA1|nr:uncharacterized protein W97_01066 [Coniosporium apollinis CBS 100218]EON61848.1 hypothetical protein W97_01066 [Coniosporium apollinis CBS 100218]